MDALSPTPADAPGAPAAPDVSIIVPALNEEDTIGEVIDRLLALPMQAEVIVVNDGSDDRTGEILASYGDQIRVLTNPRRTGKGNAIRQAEMLRELGVKASKKLPLELVERSQDDTAAVVSLPSPTDAQVERAEPGAMP